MAHFRAIVQGNRAEASRLGHKSSGIETHCNGWSLGVSVYGRYDENEDSDVFDVYSTGGSNGAVQSKLIATVKKFGVSTPNEPQAGLFLNQEQAEALTKLLDYCHDEEQKHYDADPVSGHIFESIRKLADVALGTCKTCGDTFTPTPEYQRHCPIHQDQVEND